MDFYIFYNNSLKRKKEIERNCVEEMDWQRFWNSWGLNITVHLNKPNWETLISHITLLSLIFSSLSSLFSLSLSNRISKEKTIMVAWETWRGMCYASPMVMACYNSAYYNAFSISPTRVLISTMSKPSTRCRPFLLSSMTNATPSYKTLVSEVPLLSFYVWYVLHFGFNG